MLPLGGGWGNDGDEGRMHSSRQTRANRSSTDTSSGSTDLGGLW
ncbi:unnamed protein product, partial [Ectocarpus sp. 6 AP-2014]